MKIRRLDLTAFGPFTDRSLTMAATPGTLQLLQGHNGAGKSSSLRALSALLFGFGHTTTDGWQHHSDKLRVGALLEGSGGRTLDVVRRKGRKNTLSAADGTLVPEAELEQLLGGIHEDLYSTLFALDHERLRSAGQQLVSGGEDLGESLFGAGMGRDVHQLLARLRDNASALFLPKGTKPALNKAISNFKQALSASTKSQLQPSRWRQAKQEEAQLLQTRNEVAEQINTLAPKRARLERMLRVFPLLAKYDDLQRRRNDLGDAPLLPVETRESRLEVSGRMRLGEAAIQQLNERLSELEEHSDLSESHRDLLAHNTQINVLVKRLGAQQEAASDRVRLVARMEAAREATQAALIHNELGDESEQVAGDLQTRLRKLIPEEHLLVDQLTKATTTTAQAAGRQQRAKDQLSALGEIQSPDALRSAVDGLGTAGDLPRQHAAALSRQQRMQATTDERLAQLGHWTGTLADAQRLPCPHQDTVDRFDKRWQKIDHSADQLQARQAALDLDTKRVSDDLAALAKQGHLPSEETVQASRSRRDTGWRLVQRAWLDGQSIDDEIAAHFQGEEASGTQPTHRELSVDLSSNIEAADDAADLLRRSTEQAAHLARLHIEQQKFAEQTRQCDTESSALDTARAECLAEWASAWQPCGVTPLPPKEMRTWLERLEQLREAIRELHEAQDATGLLQVAMEQHLSQIERELSSVHPSSTGDTDHSEHDDLGGKLARGYEAAKLELARLQNITEDSRQLTLGVEQLSEGLEQARLSETEAAARLKQWQELWANTITDLPLGETASTHEVEAFLDAHVALAEQVQTVRNLQARVEGIDKAQALFAQDTTALTVSCAAQLQHTEASLAVDQLATNLAAAELAHGVQLRNNAELDSCREKLDTQLTQQASDLALRDQLLVQGSCQTLDELVQAEERSQQARDLDDRLAESRDNVVTSSGVSNLATLRDEVLGLDSDALPNEIEQLAQQLEALGLQQTDAAQALGAQREIIKGLDRGDEAAEAAELAENELASVRELAQSYARQHLAAHLLEQEIQRYRQANQGPLLERAGELFRRLTVEHFTELTVAYNDDAQPSLLCRRADDREVVPQQLSEGEADQLYLALRIASLERHLEKNAALPFVADDLFITFDDERARAGLEVLGELAQKTQVIFFTHHQRLVEIAHEALGSERVELFEL
ncbi:MAG: hypothetical protein ACI9EF_000077 [Pseudohongiellaceae bacterium]